MAQYIDKSALVAKIDNIMDYVDDHWDTDYAIGAQRFADKLQDAIDTLEVKEVDYERELSKYVSNGIHRFFPNVDDDYCKMDSVTWQDYVIETAKHFFELGMQVSNKAQKGE